jgi:mono/diheme cytochrome c family protein
MALGRIGWRLVPLPGQGVVLLHQFEATFPIDVDSCTAYGGMQPIVQTAMTLLTQAPVGPMGNTITIDDAPVAVDVAVSADGNHLAIAVPGNGIRLSGAVPDVIRYSRNNTLDYSRYLAQDVDGQAIAVAYAPDGHLVVQTRAPAAIVEDGGVRIALGTPRTAGLGHTIFHTATPAGIACASCHAEGNDDGHTWNFVPMGARRTQTFRGGFLATAPFHWDGSEHDMTALVGDVYVHRMGGITLGENERQALASWLDQLPALPHVAPDDAAAVERGRTLFQDPTIGCATCHSGPLLTSNLTVDVGTGGAMQVPSLRGLRWRAPYMHSGCAATLADRFDPACGGGESHGHTAALTDAQRADLIAYLETL